VLILDIGMPKLSGIEVAARAHKMDRPPGVIILSVHGDESYIMRALAAGARAYLLKSATDEDLIPAVRAVSAGKPFFSPAVTAVLVEDYVRRLQQRGLTDSYHLLTGPREGGAAVARGGTIEQGSRDAARSWAYRQSRRIERT
jgi:DNA-binding NarL/FixJ family response regulator